MPETKNIIIYSTADWDNPFWTNKQHVAKQLAVRGYKVLYVESLGLRAPSLKIADAQRVIKRLKKFAQGLRKINNNLSVLSPLAIPGGGKFPFVKKLNDKIVRAQMGIAIKKLGLENHWAWTYNPTSLQLLSSFSPSKIIYHTVDDLSAAPGMDGVNIRLRENELLQKVDIVFCTSPKLLEYIQVQTHKPSYYFPNVVDVEHFRKAHGRPIPEDLKDIPKPILGFVGAISNYKLDMELINNTAEKHPEWSFVLIGKVGEGQPTTELSLKQLPNIHLLGPRSYDEVPAYMHHFDIGLIPCPINDYTQSMFPMKFFEYMASDTPVVARDIYSLKEFLNIHYSYGTPEKFEKQIISALNAKDTFSRYKNDLDHYSWTSRMNTMLEQIGALE